MSGDSEERRGDAKREISTLSLCLFTLLVLYAVGSGTFSWLERDAELESYVKHRDLYRDMRSLYEFDRCGEEPFIRMDFCQKQQEFNEMLRIFFERAGTEMEDHKKWTIFGSAFYITTLVTTIGYGNLHPLTPGGQLFTVLFGLVGIPAMAYVLSHIGRCVVDVWMPACPVSLDTKSKRILVLSGLLVSLILVGGAVFAHLEGWSYLQSCYFTACTLMTIGFGDLLPTRAVSRLVAVVFILFGLGVAASLIALMQIHVEIRGEHFAKQLDSWYDAIAGECCTGGVAAEAASERGAAEASPLLQNRASA
jgi:hypothetical protein